MKQVGGKTAGEGHLGPAADDRRAAMKKVIAKNDRVSGARIRYSGQEPLGIRGSDLQRAPLIRSAQIDQQGRLDQFPGERRIVDVGMPNDIMPRIAGLAVNGAADATNPVRRTDDLTHESEQLRVAEKHGDDSIQSSRLFAMADLKRFLDKGGFFQMPGQNFHRMRAQEPR